MEAATNAVRYDESSSWAHRELSTAYQLLNRIDDALAEARIAVKLNPYDARTLHALGNKSDLAALFVIPLRGRIWSPSGALQT